MRDETSQASEHLKRLDGLRGIASLTVVAGHIADSSLGYPRFGELGAVAVLFFFVLSGFVITTSLDRRRDRDGVINLGDFYLRRAFRILPAFWVFLAIVVILKICGAVTDVTWKAILACLFFVRNIRGRGQSLSHIWSLSLIEQFYFGWPLAMKRFSRAGALKCALVLSFVCAAWRTFAIFQQRYPYETDVFYLRTDFRLDSILVGAALALALRHSDWSARLTHVFDRVPFVLVLPALAAWALGATDVTALHPVFLTFETLLAILVFGRLVTRTPSHFSVRVCSWKGFAMLGQMSFSIYLWQQLFVVRHEPAWRIIGEFPFNILSIAIIALLSYRYIEKSAIKLRERLTSWPLNSTSAL